MRDCSTGVQEENKDQIKMGAIWDLGYVYVYNVFLNPLLIEIIIIINNQIPPLKKIKNLPTCFFPQLNLTFLKCYT